MITRQKIRVMRIDIEEALKAVAEKHGVTIEAGNASYTNTSFNLKLNVTENASDGSAVTQGKNDWDNHCLMFGLKREMFGKTFKTHQGEYEIVGLKPRSRKYPVLGKKVGTDKIFKFPAITVTNTIVS